MPIVKQTREQIAISDGQIFEKRISQTISWGDEPSYIKLYLQDILYLHDLPKQYVGLVFALLKRMSYAGEEDGMCIVLASRIKKANCQELGWERISSLDNAIQKLLAGKIIYRLDRSVYRFNPYLFGKGDWQEISRLRLEINYDEINGRTFQTNVDFSKQKVKKKQQRQTKQISQVEQISPQLQQFHQLQQLLQPTMYAK